MTEYQKYQLGWMRNHGYSIQDLISELTKYQYADPEDSDQISSPVSELFAGWEHDVGFGSEIWSCEDEWTNCDKKIEKLSLKERCERICQIDIMLDELHVEHENLYRDGLTTEQHNKLWRMVMSDKRAHWS